jgi:hypothetical protein
MGKLLLVSALVLAAYSKKVLKEDIYYECYFSSDCDDYSYYSSQTYCCALWDCVTTPTDGADATAYYGTYCTSSTEVALTNGQFVYDSYICSVTCSNLPDIPCQDTSYCSIFGGEYCCA